MVITLAVCHAHYIGSQEQCSSYNGRDGQFHRISSVISVMNNTVASMLAMYVQGVSTRKVTKIVELVGKSVSKSVH